MLNIQERVPTTIQNPNPDEKILFNDATDGKLKTKDSSGVIEELSTDLVGVPTGGATGEVLAKASATDGDVEWVDPTGGVKEYVALLTQTGTNAPVATVLKNTLGGTVVWTRNAIGDYRGTLENAFPDDKTTLGNGVDAAGITILEDYANDQRTIITRLSTNVLKVSNLNTLGTVAGPVDEIFSPALIKIEVYP